MGWVWFIWLVVLTLWVVALWWLGLQVDKDAGQTMPIGGLVFLAAVMGGLVFFLITAIALPIFTD